VLVELLLRGQTARVILQAQVRFQLQTLALTRYLLQEQMAVLILKSSISLKISPRQLLVSVVVWPTIRSIAIPQA
jgi:hypothetical protein